MCHTLRAIDPGRPDHLREQLDPSHAMEMGWDICVCWKGASLSTYSVQYTYLIFNLFLSYSIQVEVIDIFPPSLKIFDLPLPQLPDFPLGLNISTIYHCIPLSN